MKLAEAYVEVKTNQAKFGKELKTMESSVKRSVDRMKKNFDRIGKGVSQISGIARWGFLGMTAAIAGVTYAAQKQEKAVAKLVQQMKNHGEATQENISALTGLASELQRVTQFGDEQIIAGQAMLASFNLTTQQIKELTPHMLNLAVMTENTTGQQADLAAVAKMVGVALGGQAGRLVQMGIAMTDAQKETLRLADADEKINILMQIFEENAGGLAEAVGTTLAGSLSKAKNAMGDLAEELGFLLSPVIIKACEAIVEKVREWKEAIQALTPEQKKLITQIVFLGTAALGAIGALGLFSTVARVVQGAGLIIAGTFGLITSPLGLIMVAVGALALAWAYNWGDIQGKTKAAWDFLKPIFQGIWEALSGIEKEMEKTTGTIEKETKKQASGWETALKVIKTIGLSLKEIFLGARDIIIEVLDALGLKWEGFRWIFATGLELLATDWGEFIEDWKAGIDIIKKWLDVKFKWTLEKIGEGWKWFTDTLIPWLWTWAETTFYWLLDLTDPVWDKFKGIMQWVKEHAILYFNWAIIKIGDTWDWLEKTLWPWVKKWGVKAFEWSLDLFKKVRNWLENTLIPWTEDFKDKTFKWTLDLFGNVWDKIKDLVEWLGKIPEILKPVREGMQEVGEAAEKIVSPKVIKDMSHLESEIRGQRIALEWASKGWATYDSVAKKWIASIAATFILFEHEITDIAAKAPLEFSQEFQKGFMRATPDIQKAILDAILSGDFERALSLAGVKAGKAFMGRSPGMLTELEEGTKETKKLLDRMLGDMDAMTKKIMKIFQPIIGLFETMFKGITDRMIASENETISQMGKDIKAFVDDILALMKGLFEGIEKRTNTWYEWQGRGIKKQLSLWQKFCKAVSKIWESISETIRSAFIDTTVDIITGVTSIQKGFVDLANTIYRFLVRALIDATIQAMATSQSMIQALKSIAAEVMTTGNVIMAFITAWLLLSNRAVEETKKIQSAWGEFFETWRMGAREMEQYLKDLANRFGEVGLAISNTVEAAKRKLRELYESIEDLEKGTRERLIDELDKYYDYRMLRELTLDELIALSAKTRERIAREGIDAVRQAEESAAEKRVREQDEAINRLKTLEEHYETELDLIRQRILLTRIEIKLLEIQMAKRLKDIPKAIELQKELNDLLDEYDEKYGESGETAEEVEEQKREAIKETSRETERATEEMTRAWEELLSKIPTRIDFDVVGILHMPSIPSVGTRFFDIIGRLKWPGIPSAQVGIPYVPRPMPVVVHREEAILNPAQAREWRKGKGAGGEITHNYYQNVEVKSLIPPDDPVLYRRLWREHMKMAHDEEEARRYE